MRYRLQPTQEGRAGLRRAIYGETITAGNASQLSGCASVSVLIDPKLADQKRLDHWVIAEVWPEPDANQI